MFLMIAHSDQAQKKTKVVQNKYKRAVLQNRSFVFINPQSFFIKIKLTTVSLKLSKKCVLLFINYLVRQEKLYIWFWAIKLSVR